jgi:pilus assembly protein CpaE
MSRGNEERSLLWACPDGRSADRQRLEATAEELGFSVQYCSHEDFDTHLRVPQFDVVGIELEADLARSLARIRRLRDRQPAVAIIVASERTGVDLLRSAFEAGATDVLSLPLNAAELDKALLKASRLVPAPPAARSHMGDVVTVYGVRGGLGATTLAVNLAVQLRKLTSEDSAIVDLDLQRGDVASFMNMAPPQSSAALANAAGKIDALYLRDTLSRHESGVYVLAAPQQIEDADLVTRDEIEAALPILRNRFRHTVIDTARTLTDVTLAAFEQTGRLLVLTDLSVPGVRATRRLMELLGRLEGPTPDVDLLVTEIVPPTVKLDDAVRAIGREPALTIPRDQDAALNAMNNGAPLNGTRPSPLAVCIAAIAADVAGVDAGKKRGGRFLSRLFGRGSGARP